MSRPEELLPPEIFYNEREAKKYTVSSRVQEIQSQMTHRAMELLNLPKGMEALLLDIGCGSGLSGEVIQEYKHQWVGCDISMDMLDVAIEREEAEGDLILSDMGHGLMFRSGVFDGALSISALQWLCNADKKSHHPRKRLLKFFNSLYKALVAGGRAVFQFYPQDDAQVQLITQCAMKTGFTGGLVVDYPNSTKARKYFLCLFAGQQTQEMPKAKTEEDDDDDVAMDDADDDDDEDDDEEEEDDDKEAKGEAEFGRRQQMNKYRRRVSGIGKPGKKTKVWIQNKKDRLRRIGHNVRPDSKYTGRKRPQGF